MPSDSGLTSQDTDDVTPRQAVLNELQQMPQSPRLVRSPDALEALERAMRPRPERLGSFVGGHHLQHALDAAAWQAAPAQRVHHGATPLTNEGQVEGRVRPAPGATVPVRVTSSRRQGQRRAGKRSAGVQTGVVGGGIDARCPPALAAEVRLCAARRGSVHEAPDVLANRGVALATQTIRTMAQRDAARARRVQQVEPTAFEDPVAGRRVVLRSEGGRLRLRATQRGPKPQKGRRRQTGAGRAPKVLLVEVVEAEGKRDATWVPVLAAPRTGPAAGFALLRPSWQRRESTQADQGRCIADGAPGRGTRVPRLGPA